MTPRPDDPWLRETVDESLRELFSDNPRTVQRGVQRVMDQIPFDEELHATLIDTLQTSLEEENDDTQGTLWIVLILGRAGVTSALPVLIRTLGDERDEELQEAAAISILRLGAPGVDTLLDVLEDEEPSDALSLQAYRLLGNVGAIEDPQLLDRVVHFLRERLALDRTRPQARFLMEQCALSLAYLGDRESLARIRETRSELFFDANPVLKEAADLLRLNEEGRPLTRDVIPGDEDHAWIFEFAPDPRRARAEGDEEVATDRPWVEDVTGQDPGGGGDPIR